MALEPEQMIQYADRNSTGIDSVVLHRNPVLDAYNTTVALLAMLCNGMVITVMLLRRRAFLSFTNHLILHQSIIDAIAGVVFFFQRVVKNPGVSVSPANTIFDELFCRLILSKALLFCLYVTSTYNTVIISLERFMATCHPVKHRNSWSKSKLKFAVGIAWAIGVIYGLHISFIYHAHQGNCQLVSVDDGVVIGHVIFVMGTEYVLPVIIIVYTNTRALLTLTKKLSNPVNAREAFLRKARRNLLFTTLLVSIMFVVCWTPAEIEVILIALDSPLEELFFIAFTALLSFNMCVNPIIYCVQYKPFRAQLNELIVQKFCRKNRVRVAPEAQPPPRAIGLLQMNIAGSTGGSSGLQTLTTQLPRSFPA